MREVFQKIAFIIDILTTQTRMGIVMILGLFFTLVILITLARYTLVDHEFYKRLADRQQLREIELSVNRGTIYATLDPNRGGGGSALETSILATTSIAKDLKIDPSASCNLDMLESFLTETVYEHLCVNRTQVSCFDNMLKYTNTYITPPNFDFTRESIIAFIAPTVKEQTRRIYKTRIFLSQGLSSETISALVGLQNPGLVVIGDTAYVDPTRFDRSRGVEEVLRLTGVSASALDDALELRKNRNVDIIEKIEPELSLKINERIASQIALTRQQPLKDQADFIPKNTFYKCIKLVDNPVRQYPAGSSAAQVTGYVDSDGIGRLGIE